MKSVNVAIINPFKVGGFESKERPRSSEIKEDGLRFALRRNEVPGLPPSQGKTKNFQSQGKVRKFCKKSGKISVLVKVSEESGNFLEFSVKSHGIFWNSVNSLDFSEFTGF